MEFFIKKNATLPVLKLQVVKDGRSDYDNFMKTIESSAIFFSMVDVENGVPKISSRPAGFVEKEFIEPNAEPEYYIYYQFQNRDTNKVGRYEGQFMLRTDDGVLILPIREKLFINVQESFIADDLPYESCYTSEFPCCVNPPFITTTTTTPCPSCPTCPEPTPTPVTTTTTIPEPVTTTTTFIPITTTTTTSQLSVILEANINPGSIIIDYKLTSNQVYDEIISMDVIHNLGTLIGPPITIPVEVSIPIGELTGGTQIILSDDFNNLSRDDSFGVLNVSPINLEWIIYENYPTPTPTPTMTETPTPTPTMTETPTPTPTITPTVSSCGPNPNKIYLIYTTNTTGIFINDLVLSCSALNCLNSSSCYSNGVFEVWTTSSNPQIGDSVYSSCTSSSPSPVNGYYIVNNSSVYTLYEIINGVIISYPTCV